MEIARRNYFNEADKLKYFLVPETGSRGRLIISSVTQCKTCALSRTRRRRLLRLSLKIHY